MSFKTTVIIPSSTSPVESFTWSILSLLLRTDLKSIDQIIVSLNGPDPRTGDTSIQDQKEYFCNKLSKAGYPITLLRSWSRVGFASAIQSCLPIVNTDTYLVMHDDIIVLNNEWQKEAQYWLSQDNIEAVVQPPVFFNKLTTTILSHNPKDKSATTVTFLPSISTVFSIFKVSSNFSWTENYCWIKESHFVDLESINDFYSDKRKVVNLEFKEKSFKIDLQKATKLQLKGEEVRPELVQFNCGSWVANQLIENNSIATFSKIAHHLENMTGKDEFVKNWEVKNPDYIVREFLEDLKKSEYNKFYDFDYPVQEKSHSKIKPLICVLVYDRIDNLKKWMDVWRKSNQFDGKILIVQNADDSLRCKKIAEEISLLNPDYHWIRKNDNESMKHLFEILRLNSIDFDWNTLFAFTDDCIPMRLDFLKPFIDVLDDDEVGLCGGVFSSFSRKDIDKSLYFQRSISLAIRKEVLLSVRHMAYRKINLYFDRIPSSIFSQNCERFIWKWVKENGYKVSPTNHEWSKIFGWDCDHQCIDNLWDKFNFNIFGAVSEKYNVNDS